MNISIVTALFALVVAGIYILANRLHRLSGRLDELESKLEPLEKQEASIERIEQALCDIADMVQRGLPTHVRDRLTYRSAKQLTLTDIRSWTPGSVVKLIEADWDVDHEDPMISRYDFRFSGVDEAAEGKLGHRVRGEWRFTSGEAWKEHSFMASTESAEVRLLR